jgi:hypothetical protein
MMDKYREVFAAFKGRGRVLPASIGLFQKRFQVGQTPGDLSIVHAKLHNILIRREKDELALYSLYFDIGTVLQQTVY